MKSILLRLSSVLAVLLGILILVGFLFYPRLPDMVSDHLSKSLKVAVDIGSIHLWPNTIEINNIEVANVPGGKLNKALSVETTIFKAPLFEYFKESITIEEISLDQVYLGLEFNSASGATGNWSKLIDNLNKTSKEEDRKNEKTEKTKVLIKKLILTNIQADVVYAKDGGKIIKLKPIDRIELTNINSEKGVPTDQIMSSVLGQMLKSVFVQENLKNMLDDVLKEPTDSLDSILQPFKGLFSEG